MALPRSVEEEALLCGMSMPPPSMPPPPPPSMLRRLYDGWESLFGTGDPAGQVRVKQLADAHDRSMVLLKSWLSPEQQQDLQENGYFRVVGGDTGNVYRLWCLDRCKNAVNIFEERDGELFQRWCFGPLEVPEGDKLLAQMVALQNCENRVRRKIANRFSLEF